MKTIIDNVDSCPIEEETLSDGSKTYNIIFGNMKIMLIADTAERAVMDAGEVIKRISGIY